MPEDSAKTTPKDNRCQSQSPPARRGHGQSQLLGHKGDPQSTNICSSQRGSGPLCIHHSAFWDHARNLIVNTVSSSHQSPSSLGAACSPVQWSFWRGQFKIPGCSMPDGARRKGARRSLRQPWLCPETDTPHHDVPRVIRCHSTGPPKRPVSVCVQVFKLIPK